MRSSTSVPAPIPTAPRSTPTSTSTCSAAREDDWAEPARRRTESFPAAIGSEGQAASPNPEEHELAEIEHLSEESLPVALAQTPGPLIVEFWAPWCGPCAAIGPLLERLAREHPELRITKVNVDDEPGLAIDYEVRGIPTLIRFDGGAQTLRVAGALPYDRLLQALAIVARTDSVATGDEAPMRLAS